MLFSEHDEQVALIRWADMSELPELQLLFAIPNGGQRHPAVARKLRDEGLRAGVPDLFLPVARGNYHGLFIEMKVGRNKPTANQTGWIRALRWQGYRVEICYGYEEARVMIENYLTDGILMDGQ